MRVNAQRMNHFICFNDARIHQPVGEQVSLGLHAPQVARELVAQLELGLRFFVLVLAQLGRRKLLGLKQMRSDLPWSFSNIRG